MRPFGELIPYEEAKQIISENVVPLDRIEAVALDDSPGRVLATDVVASLDIPPFNRAAMDGYALRAQDTAGAPGLVVRAALSWRRRGADGYG